MTSIAEACKLGLDHDATKESNTRPLLSILLVNYNGVRYLNACLESIRQYAPADTQVVLVDNASTDGSLENVKEGFPWVEVVQSDRNLGFAGGNNVGAEQARGKFFLLLNTDTVLLEPIEPAIEWLQENQSYGALTINMVDEQQNSAACTGKFPTPLRLALLRSMLIQPAHYEKARTYDVDWVQGSFLLIRSGIWREVGGLDEQYFMYVEDVDLCKRVHDLGFKCAYLPAIRYLHWGGYNANRFPDQVKSLSIYVSRHMGIAEALLSKLVLWTGCALRVGLYGAISVVSNRSLDRIKARNSWRACIAITQGLDAGKRS